MRALPSWSSACARAVAHLIGLDALHLDEAAHLPEDVMEAFRDVTLAQEDRNPESRTTTRTRTSAMLTSEAGVRKSEAPDGLALEALDEEAREVIEGVLAPSEGELRARLAAGSLAGLEPARREDLIARLMLRHNKVTHIYELVKAYGESQVIKEGGRWQRRPALEAKHAYEVSVNPLTGEFSAGAGHAPLLYAADPRSDLPADLEATLAGALDGADERVVAGWVRAAGGGVTG
jgi:hypothetical protein